MDVRREMLWRERVVETFDGVYGWRRNAGGQLFLKRQREADS